MFFRSQVFQQVGPLDIKLHYYLDYDYWLQGAKTVRIGHLKTDLAASRLHFDTNALADTSAVHREILQILQPR